MKYIRTKNGNIFEIEKDLGKYGKSKAVIICDFDGNFIDVEKQNMILKQADTIEDLIQEGDLVKYEDRTTSYPYQTTFAEITKFFKPYHTAIYRIIELYIKQPNGDYKLVAQDKGVYNYKLELV